MVAVGSSIPLLTWDGVFIHTCVCINPCVYKRKHFDRVYVYVCVQTGLWPGFTIYLCSINPELRKITTTIAT